MATRPVLLLMLVLAGCGGAVPPPEARRIEDPGMVQGSHHRLYYALTPTLDLPAEIANSYDIKQRRNLALLTLSLRPIDGNAALMDASTLRAEQLTLLGQRQSLVLREVQAGSWIASVEVRQREAVTIEMEVLAAPATVPLRARMTREFILD